MLEPLAVRVAEPHAEPAAEDHRLGIEQVTAEATPAPSASIARSMSSHGHRVVAHQRARPDPAGQSRPAALLHDLEEVGLLALAASSRARVSIAQRPA